MKYKVGDKVRIKSRDWYDANKDEDGNIFLNGLLFIKPMAEYLGKEAVIKGVGVLFNGRIAYKLDIDGEEFGWFDEFIEGTETTPTDIIKDIAEVIKNNNLGVSVKEEDGKLIIEPLKAEVEDDLPIDTPCMCSDDITNWHLRYYYNKCSTYPNGFKSTDEELPQKWNYIVPFDKFNPNDIQESLKYNIVK